MEGYGLVPNNPHLPHALEMHWANLDHMSDLLALENTISPTTGHAGDIEELGAIDHVVVCREATC